MYYAFYQQFLTYSAIDFEKAKKGSQAETNFLSKNVLPHRAKSEVNYPNGLNFAK